jgi:lipid II:glycine glycyltransferase (peptidoglycan interpeptide bridge formation enzyme)
LADSLPAGLKLETSAWKEKAETAIVSDSRVERFYSVLAERAARQQWLLLHFLKAGRSRVAFEFALYYRNRIHSLKSGYDPFYSRCSPVNLLLMKVLEDAFSRGVDRYDFLGLAEHWKCQWTSHTQPHYWLFIFRNNAVGRIVHRLKFRLLPAINRYPAFRSLRSMALGLTGAGSDPARKAHS